LVCGDPGTPPARRPEGGINIAAVGSGTPEDVLRDNLAAARYAAFRLSAPTASRSAATPIAHAAC
jgi:hypothetical protein